MSAGKEIWAVEQNTGKIRWRTFVDEKTNIQADHFETDGVRIFATHVEDIRAWYIKTGELAWLTPMPEDRGMFFDNAIAYSDSRIFVGGDNNAYCLDAKTGTILWSNGLRKNSGYVSDTAVYDSLVYFGSSYGIDNTNNGGTLYALNKFTGDSIWAVRINYKGTGSIAMPPVVENGVVYVGSAWSGPSGFQAFNAKTGKEIWYYFTPNEFYHYKDAIIVDDLIITNSGWYWVTALNKSNGNLVWRKFIRQDAESRQVHYYDDYVYHTHGWKLYVIESKTGNIVHEMYGPKGENLVTIAVGNGKVFVQGHPKLMCFTTYKPE
jgi:outer membrane protein assembly factor BamB